MTYTGPAEEDLAENEVALDVTGDLDEMGRAQFTAYWLDDCLSLSRLRGQVFHTKLAAFVRRETARGHKVTAFNERTHKILDGLET
jgi:hypothetical protein